MKKNIKFICSTIITSLLVLTLIFLIVAQISLEFKLDSSFWFTFTTGTIIMVITVLVWLPSGKERGEKDKKYLDNKDAYDTKANNIIKEQSFDKLSDFCEYKNEKKKEEKIQKILGKVGVNYDDFIAIKNVSEVEKSDRFVKKQKKTIIKLLTKEIKYSKISSYQLTTSIDSEKGESYKNYEVLKQYGYIVMRVLTSLATSLFLAGIVIKSKSFSIAELTQILIWISAIGTNLINGFIYGIKLVTNDRNQYYIKLYTILCEFEEWKLNPKFATRSKKNIKPTNLSKVATKCHSNDKKGVKCDS